MIATAVTLPVIVIIALLLSAGSDSGSGDSTTSPGAVLDPVTVSAPPSTDDRTISVCANVIGALPLRLAGQDVRRAVSDPSSPSIVAWGDPAIVLRCGVSRPAELTSGSSTVFVTGGTSGDTGPFYDVQTADGANVWTTVDRAVYIEITVPTKYNSEPLPAVSRAIAKVLPAVCVAGQPNIGTVDQAKLCVRRP